MEPKLEMIQEQLAPLRAWVRQVVTFEWDFLFSYLILLECFTCT